MYMYTERIDPSEFMMVKKSSDHVAMMEENRTLKISIALFFSTLIVIGVASMIFDYRKTKKSDT